MLVLITTGENLLYWDQRGLTKKNLVAPWKISRKFFQNKSIFHGGAPCIRSQNLDFANLPLSTYGQDFIFDTA